MPSDQINLKAEVLSDDAEHQTIGLLVTEPRFARSVLQGEHELNNIQLEHLFKYFKDSFKLSKGKKHLTKEMVIYLIKREHDHDLPRQKEYISLLSLCVEMTAGIDWSVVYNDLQEVARNKSQMKKSYDLAMAFDPEHNPLAKRSGPEFNMKVAELAQAVLDTTKQVQDGAPTPEETKDLLLKQAAAWEIAVQNRVPLIDPEVPFKLTPGITLIGGKTKSGKSTFLANLVPAILEARPDKKVLVITCEDNLDLVLSRIACVMHETPLKTYRESKKDMPKDLLAKINETKLWLCERIVVASEGTTQVETTQKCLDDAKVEDYSAVLLDYYQVVNTSRHSRTISYVEILKNFGLWLKEYAQNLQFPVIIFAMLKNTDENENIPFALRVQMDTHIANHAHVSLELHKHDDQGKTYTEICCELSRHSDPLGPIAKFNFMGGKLKLVKENPNLASNLQQPPPDQAALKKAGDDIIKQGVVLPADAKAQPANQ